MTNPNLPEGQEHLKTEKKYIRPAQLKEGENRFRVVQRPIAGWLDWENNKPKRYRPDEKPKRSFDPDKPAKAFWDMYVWDYDKKDLYVFEVTQNSLIKSLEGIITDEDWGDMTGYDIKIKKEGSGKDTRYSVQPIPHKPMPDEVKTCLKASPVRLEALYDNGDPWRDLGDPEEYKEGSVPSVEMLGKILKDSIVLSDPSKIVDYLNFCAPKISKPLDEAVELWLTKPKEFAAAFEKWLVSNK
jgi:hypothetical protein